MGEPALRSSEQSTGGTNDGCSNFGAKKGRAKTSYPPFSLLSPVQTVFLFRTGGNGEPSSHGGYTVDLTYMSLETLWRLLRPASWLFTSFQVVNLAGVPEMFGIEGNHQSSIGRETDELDLEIWGKKK